MSPTPLDVTVKIEKTESDHDDANAESAVGMGEESTLDQSKWTHPPIHTITIKIEPGDESGDEPQAGSMDDDDAVDDNDMWVRSEMEMKLEPIVELTEDPLHCGLDYDDAAGYNGSAPTNEFILGTNESSEMHQHISADTDATKPFEIKNAAAINYIPRNYRKCKYRSKQVNISNVDDSLKETIDSIKVRNIALLIQAKIDQDINNDSGVTSDEKSYTCEICYKTFNDNSGLTKHVKTHKVEYPYACKVCDARFNNKSNFNRHIRTHTGDKRYACEICHKKFSDSTGLNKHARIHTGIKPYSCNLCDKKFSQSIHLNNHIRMHTGEKPFACNLCDKKFTQSGSYIRHMRTHTGEKPYACKICGRKFSESGALNRHGKVHMVQKPETEQKPIPIKAIESPLLDSVLPQ